MQLTPMMQQYMEVKRQYEDCILFYRLGDFYEMFFEDALTGARELEITLTARNCGLEEKAPMCGVPFHACDTYITKLIEKGYKVAVCEQTEDPSQTKGIVKREVTRIVTPGTVVGQNMLSEKENNYLACVIFADGGAGISFCDISTGEIKATEIVGDLYFDKTVNEMVKVQPKEILINDTFEAESSGDTAEFIKEMSISTGAFCAVKSEAFFNRQSAEKAVCSQFNVKALSGIGLGEKDRAVCSLGALLSYMIETQKQGLSHILRPLVYDLDSHMSMDKSTIKNLELTETLFEKKVQGSLLWVLDKTQTAMGSRKIKQWIKEPLNNKDEINERLDALETLFEDGLLRNNIREYLKSIYDLERLSGRVACSSANGRDLVALKNSIAHLPEIKGELEGKAQGLLKTIASEIDDMGELYDLIDKAVKEEPPYAIKEGGIIKELFSDELDAIKASISDGQRWIADLESRERERTGIKSLKVGFTRVFGYYIEVTKSYYDLIPEEYIRKQTLANCERFVTQELKEVESAVLGAEAKINQLEYEIFLELRNRIQEFIPAIQRTSSAISSLDVLCSFAEVSSKLDYVRPDIDDSDRIEIEKGRHPVIEQTTRDGIFVSNDTYVDGKDNSMLLITGPNMSGKSTYMRQSALIVLMAQTGCFVPAASARIGVVDKIFTRIGSSDNLSQGQSTFFVEMSELAFILNTATPKSLIILDEIGRGTSTYDGLSIAYAAVSHLCAGKERTRTLFATHYHELTLLASNNSKNMLQSGKLDGIKNLNVDVKDRDGDIIFLHKIVEGSASRSYGIHVARLAGVPDSVLQVAQDKLALLEAGQEDAFYTAKEKIPKKQPEGQISFFDMDHPVLEKIRSVDLMQTTPMRAFEILEELQRLLK